MADWELLDDHSGMRTYLGGEDDTVLVRREFDPVATTALLDLNKARANEGWDRKSEMVHAASIPISIMYEWLTKHGVSVWNPHHGDAVKKLLNSSDYRYLKCADIYL